MALLTILLHPDRRLQTVATRIDTITDRHRKLADNMLETMYDAPGVGLAAPQVGVLERLVVMDCSRDEEQSPRPLVLFNPEIVAASEEREVDEEGCLSIPQQYADVERPAEVTLQWQDLDGRQQQEHFAGLWAKCAQHEIDHLNGVLFIDHLKPLKRQLMTRKAKKLKRESALGRATS